MIPTAIQSPFRRQWDEDSTLPPPYPGTGPGNCGVACVTMAAEFYRDIHYGIYATRRLVVSNDSEMFTRIGDQSLMLAKRGVPNHIGRPSVAEVKRMLATRVHPVILGLDMSKVPPDIAGHLFRGNHAIIFRGLRSDGVALGADPNFHRVGRSDPTGGRRPYPDWVLQAAYYNAGMWAVVPDKPKLVSLPDTSTDTRIDGDPHPMKFRSVDYRRTIREGRPIRAAATVGSRVLERADSRKSLDFIGRIPEKWLPSSERQFGDVLITRYYTGSGHVLGYVKQVDLAGN